VVLKTGPQDKVITDSAQRAKFSPGIFPIWNGCTKKVS
jgi:hypothetical protein